MNDVGRRRCDEVAQMACEKLCMRPWEKNRSQAELGGSSTAVRGVIAVKHNSSFIQKWIRGRLVESLRYCIEQWRTTVNGKTTTQVAMKGKCTLGSVLCF